MVDVDKLAEALPRAHVVGNDGMSLLVVESVRSR